jgi:peptidoglycan/LPS O-acetylase OafA/YrhL
LAIGFGGITLLAAARPERGRGWLIARALAWLGTYSYTIYLSHAVLDGLRELDDVPWPTLGAWPDRLAYLALAVVGGVLLTAVVERPWLALRDRWFPSSGRRLAPSTPTVGLASVAVSS